MENMCTDNYGFVRIAAASPRLKVANPDYNVQEILKLTQEASKQEVALIVFPELCLSGYTCADLFNQKILLEKSLTALEMFLAETENNQIVSILGIALKHQNLLFNCALVAQGGKILGVVPKGYLPYYREYYEKRWFNSGNQINHINEIYVLGGKVPFGKLLFNSHKPSYTFGIEICEDLWATIPPSSYLALKGATIIVNPSASNELVAKSSYRKQLVLQQSARAICGYVYSSAGVHESTTDMVFSGDCLICENGTLLEESPRFSRESTLTLSDIDIDILEHERQVNKTFADSILEHYYDTDIVQIPINNLQEVDNYDSFNRKISKYPFVPENPLTMKERCEDIFNIQVAGLAKRMEYAGLKHAVIGISGGLDSTLALIVTKKTFEILGLPSENILAVTMPGFGTTDQTYNNAIALMKSLNVTLREISIKEACLLHFKDIGHDPSICDTTYENVQARERTQILMDISNKIGGLVVGTGDLSEFALGWCTYNGDHMSMYAVNSGIPKTLVKFLITWAADTIMEDQVKEILYKVLETPISPELLPPDKDGKIQQKTESLIGPYELHDFFFFYTVRYGMKPKKVLFLAEKAYGDRYSREEIRRWLKGFYRRFFINQFKRSCLPDGPKVGSVSLSPRGDWRMPSDADYEIWVSELDR